MHGRKIFWNVKLLNRIKTIQFNVKPFNVNICNLLLSHQNILHSYCMPRNWLPLGSTTVREYYHFRTEIVILLKQRIFVVNKQITIRKEWWCVYAFSRMCSQSLCIPIFCPIFRLFHNIRIWLNWNIYVVIIILNIVNLITFYEQYYWIRCSHFNIYIFLILFI